MRWVLFFLVVVFGSSTWMGTNSIWMQLPLLTQKLPEFWNLSSYISLIVQIACVAPLLYGFITICFTKIPYAPLVFGSLVFASACQLGLVFFWKDTISVNGKSVSLAFFILLFGLAMVDSLSSVLFMPFMAKFHVNYLNAYFIGMGFSALLPSILSLIQGTSRSECRKGDDGKTYPYYYPPHFSVSIFFLIVFFWTFFAGISFLFLYKMKSNDETLEAEKRRATESSVVLSTDTQEIEREAEKQSEEDALKGWKLALILCATALVNAQMNGIITSIQIYATLPYSEDIFHYGVTFSNVVSPLASFIPFFYVVRSLPVLAILTLTTSAITGFIIYLASLSPNRIFDSETAGGALAITAVLVAAGLHNYLRLVFANLLREGKQSERRLFWCGAFIQIGSFLGSIIMFPLVNVWKVFKAKDPCH